MTVSEFRDATPEAVRLVEHCSLIPNAVDAHTVLLVSRSGKLPGAAEPCIMYVRWGRVEAGMFGVQTCRHVINRTEEIHHE